MATISAICDICRQPIEGQFDSNTGSRDVEIIAGDLYVSERCFVRDEIRFLNTGRLIFVPDRERKEYHDEYHVVCRRLIIVGGHKPGQFDPCGPDSPGTQYGGNNVITWSDRLASASDGAAPVPMTASDGTSHDRNNWTSSSAGNNGADGGVGDPGNLAGPGSNGRAAPSFTLVALEVDAQAASHLTIDFDGQNGGRGGRGQNGGDGGDGMGGRVGESDTTWPGTGCDRQPGHGGDGGKGGDGGTGGSGGAGGRAGNIQVFSTVDNITTGDLVSGKFTYVNDGGSGGFGGLGGVGGRGGRGGKPGFKTSECDGATEGQEGAEGLPSGFPAGPGSTSNQGGTGGNGGGGSLKFDEVPRDTCIDLVPLPIKANVPAVTPSVFCRGFSAAATHTAALGGLNLSQVQQVSCSLAGVNVIIQGTSTDTQLNLRFDVAGNSAIGAGNLTLTPGFGAPVVLNNAITVQRFEVTAIAPNTGARGATVAVTITGSCFDTSAATQQVNLSELGVDVLNVLVVDSTTVTCVFDIGNLAPQTARHVTVKTGPLQHTLLNGFTVT